MYLSSTHFYLFMTISCLVLVSALSCNANIQRPQYAEEDLTNNVEKLPVEHNESRHLIHTTSPLNENTDETESSRTFGLGRLKKLQFALLPVMYKLGVMSTIIMLIFFLSLKGVFIGTLLLIMNVIFFAIKIASLKHSSHTQQWSPGPQWQPPIPPPNYWPRPASDTGGVHVHIHNAEPVIQAAPTLPSIPYEPYGSYLPSSNNYLPEPYGSPYPSNNYKPGFSKRSL